MSITCDVILRLVTEETATTLAELQEVLIADPRGCLSPSQLVQLKLEALLANCPLEFYTQATGRLEDLWKMPREPKTRDSFS